MSGTACNTETDAEGRVLDIVYTVATGLVSKVIDPAGRTWTFSYDGNKNLIGIQNPRTYSETFGYDTASANPTMVHDMTTLTLPNGQTGGPDAGHAYVIAYAESVVGHRPPGLCDLPDRPGRPRHHLLLRRGRHGLGSAPPPSPIPTATSARTTTWTGVLMSHVDGANSLHPETTSYVRNAADMPTTVTDGNGNTTTYTYDSNGNLLTSTDAQSHIWTYTYNQFNELLTATPPSGSAGDRDHQHLRRQRQSPDHGHPPLDRIRSHHHLHRVRVDLVLGERQHLRPG